MEFMIPTWNKQSSSQAARNDLTGLVGVPVALVDDNFDSEVTREVLRQLGEVFRAQVTYLLKPLGSAASPASLIDQAAGCRVAVVGVGA